MWPLIFGVSHEPLQCTGRMCAEMLRAVLLLLSVLPCTWPVGPRLKYVDTASSFPPITGRQTCQAHSYKSFMFRGEGWGWGWGGGWWGGGGALIACERSFQCRTSPPAHVRGHRRTPIILRPLPPSPSMMTITWMRT